VQTGGGEVFAEAALPDRRLAATESWLPNVNVAKQNLAELGASVVGADDDVLPFRSDRSTSSLLDIR
jgi:hypothetical protein